MSLVDDILRALPVFRAEAEALMLDACTITRPGEVVTDPETGDVTNTATEVYAGKCKVQSREGVAASPEAGEARFTVVSRQVHIPANAADVRDGDVVTLTASRLNAFTVGKQYRVEGFTPDTFDTAARLPVKEIL
jgi:NMD protein affecting ribosome stability and mRNA decay